MSRRLLSPVSGFVAIPIFHSHYDTNSDCLRMTGWQKISQGPASVAWMSMVMEMEILYGNEVQDWAEPLTQAIL